MPHYKLLIGGEYVDTAERYDVVSPGNAEVIATLAKGEVEHVDLAVAAAERAFKESGWRQTPAHVRAEVVARAAEQVLARSAEISEISSRENGTPIRLAAGLAVGFPVMHMQYFAGLARTFVADRPAYVNGSVTGIIRHEPIGVVAGIIPWNFPLLLAVWKAVPAILAGNSIVLKVDEKTPATAFILAEILSECGLPAGVLNIVTGDGETVGGRLTAHPRVRKISFTGSTATGRTVMRNAAANVKQVTLELGGKGANIVLPDADLDLAIDGTLWGFLMHAGQACESGTRLFVHDSIYDTFVERLVKRASELTVGDPMDPATDIGPVMSAAQLARIESLIDSAVAEGAKLEYQGKPSQTASQAGYFVPPTIFTNVTPAMRVAAEEVFGPVLSVMRFSDVDAVVEEANNTEYGLAAGVWSRDIAAATEIAGRLESGTVWINDWHSLPGPLPFGGHKQSGFGREMGPNAILAFTNEKVISIDQSGREARAAWSLLLP
ncbi:MAG TPA: aldehyde dehydrogenase family protein [Nakamurella multipartita]|nr:aldehyde dehydrogenase family protein [Nakamurella multipartita]